LINFNDFGIKIFVIPKALTKKYEKLFKGSKMPFFGQKIPKNPKFDF